jgi:hypothetical protein
MCEPNPKRVKTIQCDRTFSNWGIELLAEFGYLDLVAEMPSQDTFLLERGETNHKAAKDTKIDD